VDQRFDEDRRDEGFGRRRLDRQPDVHCRRGRHDRRIWQRKDRIECEDDRVQIVERCTIMRGVGLTLMMRFAVAVDQPIVVSGASGLVDVRHGRQRKRSNTQDHQGGDTSDGNH
jgi:hypothetical protein